MSFRRYRIDAKQLSVALFAGCWLTASLADITLDGSLGPGGPLAGPNFQIPHTVGRTVGPNLFHSFGEFNIFSGESATFSGPGAIDNVLGRVTGGNPSTINGALRSTIPSADVYLVNPQGVMFGPEASLDVQGSFYASSANHVLLQDGGRFDVSNPAASVLTAAPPDAFGFLGANGPITVNRSNVSVPEGKTLAFLGGDITVEGSGGLSVDAPTIAAPGGRVDLVSVTSAGNVPIGGAGAGGFAQYGDVTLRNSVVSVSADASGAVYIRGGQVVIDTASVLSETVSSDGGDITIKGDSVLAQYDGPRTWPNGSWLTTSTSGTGDGGAIQIEAQSLNVQGGYGFYALTSDFGRGGDIRLDVSDLELRGIPGIFAGTDGSGRGGDVRVNADSVLLLEDQQRQRGMGIDTDAGFGDPNQTGDAGDIFLTAGIIELDGRTWIGSFIAGQGDAGDVHIKADRVLVQNDSWIEAGTEGGTGNGGSIFLDVGTLELRTGGSVVAFTLNDEGDTGDIHINADNIIASADGHFLTSTGIGTFTFFGTAGDMGDIIINAGSIQLREASIDNTAFSRGAGGNVTITADNLLLDGAGTIFPRTLAPVIDFDDCTCLAEAGTQIGAGGPYQFSGPPGDIDITANTVTVRGGAAIEALTGSTNPAGSISIQASSILVETDSRIDTGSVGFGPGGSVNLSTENLSLWSGGQITGDTTGPGAGGTVNIAATGLVSIDGRGETGPSGVLTGSSSTAANAGTAGDINLSAYELHLTNGGQISTSSAVADGGNVNVMAEYMVYLRDSAITTSVGAGGGAGGNVFIDPVFVVLDSSRIEANAFGGPGGNILIVTEFFIASSDSVVEASSQQDIAGSVEVRSPDSDVSGGLVLLPAEYLDSASQLATQCAAQGGQTAATLVGVGRGGLPVSPGGPMLANYATGRTQSSSEGLGAEVSEEYGLASSPESTVDLAEFVPQTLRLECRV